MFFTGFEASIERLVATDVQLLGEISDVDNRVTNLNSTLTDVDVRVTDLDAELSALEDTVSQIDVRVSQMEVSGKHRPQTLPSECNFENSVHRMEQFSEIPVTGISKF